MKINYEIELDPEEICKEIPTEILVEEIKKRSICVTDIFYNNHAMFCNIAGLELSTSKEDILKKINKMINEE